MRLLKLWLLGDKHNIMRMSVLWNFVASMEYSFQSAVLMLVVTRSNGLYEAGIFTIAYTVTQMMATIGSYGMRSFQVSDIKKEYAFDTYFSSRILTVFFMIIICISYSWLHGYDRLRMILVVILCGYRSLEDMEDIVHGEMQKAHRLDIGAKIESVRIFVSTLVFTIACFTTHDMVFAGAAMLITAVFAAFVLNLLVIDGFSEITFKWQTKGIYGLLLSCLPVCISGFLYNYLVNAPKYAIDRNLSEESQVIFSILFMPIFVINMLSSFIYKPLMTDMGIFWEQKKIKKFSQVVFRQFLIIMGFTALTVAGGMVIGLNLLGYIYNVNLGKYKSLFALLLVFGGFAAADAFLVVVLTIIRKQQWTIAAYLMSVICIWGCMDKMTCTFGLWGAGILYGMVMGIIMLIFLVVFFISMYRSANHTKN